MAQWRCESVNQDSFIKQSYATYLLFWLIFTSRFRVGTNAFEEDWDVLVVLDACRVDALREVKDEYDFLDDIESIWSVGSTSREWVENTFVKEFREEINRTAYITGNPFSDVLIGGKDRFNYGAATNGAWLENSNHAEKLIRDNMVRGEELGDLEILQPENPGTIRPRSVTDHTIKAGRAGRFNRIVSHYMQPHTPYYSSSKNYEELEEFEKSPFKEIRAGAVERGDVWQAYLDNLRYVLDDVRILLNNVDGDVVITADHGELFGEYGMYQHHAGNLHPDLRKVPWVRIKASDEEAYVPDVELDGIDAAEQTSDEQLRALGYR